MRQKWGNMTKIVHYKLHKSRGKWLLIGVTFLSVAVFGVSSVSADQTSTAVAEESVTAPAPTQQETQVAPAPTEQQTESAAPVENPEAEPVTEAPQSETPEPADSPSDETPQLNANQTKVAQSKSGQPAFLPDGPVELPDVDSE